MRIVPFCALTGTIPSASAAAIKGFNYGAQGMTQDSFQAAFKKAAELPDAPSFDSARLYTMIQEGTVSTPISAIPAAIATKTNLLLGVWCSAGQELVTNEIIALQSAIEQYGSAFTSLIQGISVGSEDLYRITPTALENNEYVGAGPDTIAKYIQQVRKAIVGTGASDAPIGHVDTWTAWVNSSNRAVIEAVDFVGMDAYPNFQVTMENNITSGKSLFLEALSYTKQAAGSKPVWITETGWPYSGEQIHDAVPSVENAKIYWDDVGCNIFGQVHTWWYDLYSPLFGILGNDVNAGPLFNLSCRNTQAIKSVRSSAVSVSSVRSPTNPHMGPTTAQPVSIPTPIPSAGFSLPSSLSITVTANATSSVTATSRPVTSPMIIQFPTSTCEDSTSRTCSTSTTAFSYLQVPQTSSKAPNSSPSDSCGTLLVPGYLFPHPIIPVDSREPNTPQGNSYNGNVSNTISSVFNFDIPPMDSDKTCSLIFLLPSEKSFTLKGTGGISVTQVQPATDNTTFADVIQQTSLENNVGAVNSVERDGTYVISKGSCRDIAGKAVGYLVSAIKGTRSSLGLEWFQDSGEPPIGLYMNIC